MRWNKNKFATCIGRKMDRIRPTCAVNANFDPVITDGVFVCSLIMVKNKKTARVVSTMRVTNVAGLSINIGQWPNGTVSFHLSVTPEK